MNETYFHLWRLFLEQLAVRIQSGNDSYNSTQKVLQQVLTDAVRLEAEVMLEK